MRFGWRGRITPILTFPPQEGMDPRIREDMGGR